MLLRITYRTQSRDILTGLCCLKENCSAEIQQGISSQHSSSLINKELSIIFQKVKERFHELKYNGMDFSIDELVDRLRGKEAAPQTLMEYTELKLQELRALIGLDMTKTTYYKYNGPDCPMMNEKM